MLIFYGNEALFWAQRRLWYFLRSAGADHKPEFSKSPANFETISKVTHIKKVEDNDVQQTR